MLVVKRLIRAIPTQNRQTPLALIRLIHQQSKSTNDLLQALSSIHESVQKSKVSKREMRKKRESNTKQGLATPSFSWEPGCRTEEQLLEFVLENIPMDKLKDDVSFPNLSYAKVTDFWKVVRLDTETEKTMLERGDWNIPSEESMKNKHGMIQYIRKMTSKSQYSTPKRKMRFFDWLEKFVESYGDRIPLEGYALIIRNLHVDLQYHSQGSF
ncbi:unnamed protein product [Ambrosiozyma monospora]|uniref:Unnamed protein product n=1 Tax=Ambrosiozyma monospora TaxID=43982 RepID=A0ACB5U719_AMBMO|nr:unnamed protein product [Ambrosiozyma monospora]